MIPFYEHPMATIINADCVVAMKSLPPDSIDLTVTSPPYDGLRLYNGYSFDFEAVARELYRITKPGGVVVWVVGDETKKGDESGTSFRQALFFKEIGFKLADTMIYHKTDMAFPRHGHRKYPAAFEYMFVFTKGAPKTFFMIRDRANKKAGAKMSGTVRSEDGTLKKSHSAGRRVAEVGARSNVWGYSIGKGKTTGDTYAFAHPAMFPEQLAEDHIISWSNVGDVVFDPFSGAGTTGKMAVKNGRRFIGSDVSDEYCDIAKRRIESVLTA